MHKKLLFAFIYIIFSVTVSFASTTALKIEGTANSQELLKALDNKPEQLNLTNKEKEYLKSHPVIKVHNEANWPPFNYNKKGIAKGFSIDYMNLLAKKLDIKVEYISGYSWSEFMDMLQTPALDVIINIVKNKQRIKTICFTDEYYSAQAAIYVHKNNSDFNSLKDLENRTVASPKGFNSQRFLEKNYPNIKQVLVKNKLEALKLLSLGKVDAVIGIKGIMDHLIENNIISNILATQYIEDEGLTSYLRLGTSKQNKIIRDILQKAQNQITYNELKELKHKWFGAKQKSDVIKIKFTKKEKDYLKNKKEITMCIDPNWMPYEKIKNGKHIGISNEYMNIFETKINIPIKLVKTTSWEESLEFAKQRKCDILSLTPEVPKRAKYMNFTNPLIKTNLVIITKTDKGLHDNAKNIISTKTLAIRKGYAYIGIAKKMYPTCKFIYINSLEEGLDMVKDEKVYGMIEYLISARYKLKQKYSDSLIVSTYIKNKIILKIAVRNDDGVLLGIFNKLVQSIDDNTKELILNNISRKFYKTNVNYRLIWQIAILSLIVILIILYWVRILKKEVNRREIAEKKSELLNNNLKEKIKIEVDLNIEKEKLLFEQAKMASMGEMIGNIAHQWRQPLSVISTASTGMKMQKEFGALSDEQFNQNCDAINNNAQYLSKTIDDFKNFIKGDRVLKTFNLEDNINSFLHLVEGSIKSNHINIILDLKVDIKIDGYDNELIQCFINIFNNAKDVLKEIENQDDRIILISTILENNKAIIKIKDSGGGIPVDILPKIFEPYFTTKHSSQGTGLGLHMTYNLIVDGMGGTIEAHNVSYEYEDKEYTGAEFIISIPMSQ